MLHLIFYGRRYILIVMFFILVVAVILSVSVSPTFFPNSWECPIDRQSEHIFYHAR
jgi:hypothetical protein